MIDARSVETGARTGGLRFRIEDFRRGDEVPVGIASARDQDTAIGERGGGVNRARSGEVIERLDLLRTRGAHPRRDRQHDDRAEHREEVSEDVIGFGGSLRIRGAFFVGGNWGVGELLETGSRNGGPQTAVSRGFWSHTIRI